MSTAPNILIVDDEPSMRRYLRTMLEMDSYQVETVDNGSEALARLQHDPSPDLILLDLLMPGIDGLQTLEQLRRLHPHQKVVMLSCVSEPRKVVQAIRLGAPQPPGALALRGAAVASYPCHELGAHHRLRYRRRHRSREPAGDF